MSWLTNYIVFITLACVYTLAMSQEKNKRLKPLPKNLTQSDIDLMRLAKMHSIKNFMDTNIHPCDDFYNFACGKWNKTNPANTLERLTTGIFEDMSRFIDIKVEKLLTNDPDFNYTAIDNKVKDFFVSCVNLPKLTDQYKRGLLNMIREFGEMPALSADTWNEENFDWVATIAKIAHKYGKHIILGMDIMADYKNNSVNQVYIGQADLPLESREMYLGRTTVVYRDSYRSKIRKQLIKFLGIDAQLAGRTANEIVDFEVKLAHGLNDDSLGQTIDDLSKLTTVELMQAKYRPQINIKKLVNITLGEVITDPLYEYAELYQQNLKEVMKTTPKAVVANYIFYTLISDHMIDFDKSAEKQNNTCIEKTKSYFAKNLDNMVYRKYSTGETERDVEYMWMKLKESFKSKLLSGELHWIAAPTLRYALEKLEALRMEINSYKDHDFNEEFGALVTSKTDYLINVLAILELGTNRSRAQLHAPPKPIEAGEILSYTPANILIENVIKVPVSLLQPYFLWSKIYPAAIKFGTLGALVGHELIHAFDDTGRLFDKNGNSRDWWDEKSANTFLNRIECFSNQYSKYKYGDRFLPKSVAQSENIADNGGMRLAYRAYLRWYQDSGRDIVELKNEQLPDFSYNFKQLFFISFAQIWCNDAHPDVKNIQTSTDQHVPGEFRVIGSLSNFGEFANVFECQAGTRMNPKNKCEIY